MQMIKDVQCADYAGASADFGCRRDGRDVEFAVCVAAPTVDGADAGFDRASVEGRGGHEVGVEGGAGGCVGWWWGRGRGWYMGCEF